MAWPEGTAATATVPLSGAGTVTLVNGAAFGINGIADAAFAGGVIGTGTVTKTGAAVQALSGELSFKGSLSVHAGVLRLEGATLTGVTNIAIRSGGELAGSATVHGDLTVTFEGGAYSGNLSVSGALAVNGPVKLSMPADATLPFSQTLVTYASADAQTRAALAAAVTPVVPDGYRASVRVTDTSARLSVAVPGMRLLLR